MKTITKMRYALCHLLFFSIPLSADDYLKKPLNPIRTIAQQYLASFSIDIDKEIVEKGENEIASPELSNREVAKILLLMVSGLDNKALQAYLKEAEKSPLQLRPITWENLKLFVGNQSTPQNNLISKIVRPNASELEKVGTTIRLISGTTDTEKLTKEKRILEIMHQNREKITKLYDRLATLEKSVLAFYDESKDPIQSSVSKKKLAATYANKDGRFVNAFAIDFNKIMHLERSFLLTLLGPFTSSVIAAVGFRLAAWKLKISTPETKLWFLLKKMLRITYIKNPKNLITFNIPSDMEGASEFFAGMLGLMVTLYTTHFLYSAFVDYYRQYNTYNKYIRQRLLEVQELFAIAKEIDDFIAANPELEALCGPKLAHTRQLLHGKHENPLYNTLSDRFRTLNFKEWSVFFNSTGMLLTTLTMLIENIHMLDTMLFELSNIGSYVALLHLLDKNEVYNNQYTYVTYIPDQEREYVDITFENLWNPFIARNKAVPNTIVFDGENLKAVAITGPNASGKSVVTSAIALNVILAQSYGIASAQNAKMTPIRVLFVFKEPKDDLSKNKSLFAMELEIAKAHLSLLGGKTLTIIDEFMNSTNPKEADAIQVAYLKYILENFPKNVCFISTHNDLLIKYLLSIPEGKIMHVEIERYQDGSYWPLYTIAEGPTDEQVGIDLLGEVLKDYPDIYKEAKNLHKKNQGKTGKLV